MPFNIVNFKTNISGGGYLTNNRFKVILTPPPILFNTAINNTGSPENIINIAKDLSFRVESIRTPGITLINADVNHYGVGPTQKQPMNAQFGDTAISIMSDGYGNIWQFWHNWIRGIFEFTGTSSARGGGPSNKIPSYTSEYKDQYSTTIQIIMYDIYGNEVQQINLFEAFPNSMREVNLNWADQGNLLRLNIGFSYTEYTIESSEVQTLSAEEQQFISQQNVQNLRNTTDLISF